MTGNVPIGVIQNLADRVAHLEASRHPAWVPIAVSILAMVVTGSISMCSLLNGVRRSKTAALQSIKANIDTVKGQIESVSIHFSLLLAVGRPSARQREELRIMQRALDGMTERLLSAYEDGCAQYFGGLVNKRHFVQAYHQDIVTYVVAYEDKFSPPLTRFSYIIRYVEESKRLKW